MSSTQRIFSNVILTILLNLIVKPFWVFFVDRVVQVQNGNSLFGVYGKYFSLSIVFSILLDLGISNYNQIQAAINPKSVHVDFGTYWKTKLWLALLYLLIMHGIFLLVGEAAEYQTFLMVSLIQVFTSLSIFMRSTISGLHKFRLDAWLSVIDKIIVLVLATGIIYGLNSVLDINFYAGIQAFGFMTVVALGFLFLPYEKFEKDSFSAKKVGKVLKHGLPFAILIFLMSVYTRFDPFLLERLSPGGSRDSGIYIAAYRFIDIISSMGYLFANILLPVFARKIVRNQNSTDLMNLFIMFFVGGGFFAASYLYFFSLPICELLYTENIFDTNLILQILAWSIPSILITNVFSAYITAAMKLSILTKVTLTAAVLYLVIMIVLIPTNGILTPAYTSTALYWLLSLTFVYIAHRKLNQNSNQWLQIISVAIGTFLLAYFLSKVASFELASVIYTFVGVIYLIWVYKNYKAELR